MLKGFAEISGIIIITAKVKIRRMSIKKGSAVILGIITAKVNVRQVSVKKVLLRSQV